MIFKKGYTLIELIIVLALISILFIMAIPSTGFFIEIQEKRELEGFRKDLLFARNRAIIESRDYDVKFHIDDNQYFIIRTGENLETIKSKKFEKGIRFDKNNLLNSITFKHNGTTKDSGTFYLRNSKNYRYEITLSPVTGRIKVEVSNFK